MEIQTNKEYTLAIATENSFSDFFDTFIKKKLALATHHKILTLSEKLNTTSNDLSLFLDIAKNHKKEGLSFIIICNEIDIDQVPEDLQIAPTFTEAKDLLEMEAIARDLGF
jgi:hypothetical protein